MLIEMEDDLASVAEEMGLNVAKTCENALKEAIRRLQKVEHPSVRNAEAAGSNPARSTLNSASFGYSTSNHSPFQTNILEILVNPRMLVEFEFMLTQKKKA